MLHLILNINSSLYYIVVQWFLCLFQYTKTVTGVKTGFVIHAHTHAYHVDIYINTIHTSIHAYIHMHTFYLTYQSHERKQIHLQIQTHHSISHKVANVARIRFQPYGWLWDRSPNKRKTLLRCLRHQGTGEEKAAF